MRAALRSLGEQSGVGIEPPGQTRLLDAMVAGCPGLVAAGVPGAGGADAVFAVVVAAARPALEALWLERSSRGGAGVVVSAVCPLLLDADPLGGVVVCRD